MNLNFYYYVFNDKLFPTVEIDDYEILSMYLLDNGGCFSSYVDFLEECILSIKNNFEFDMSSNLYGVIKNHKNVKIYYLCNEDDNVSISLTDFVNILQLWVHFIKKEPDLNYREEHVI